MHEIDGTGKGKRGKEMGRGKTTLTSKVNTSTFLATIKVRVEIAL